MVLKELKAKTRARRLDIVNKAGLLQEMRRARGHAGVKKKMLSRFVNVSSWNRVPSLRLSLYAKHVKQAFADARHMCVAWDQSFHSEDTNVLLC